MFTCKKNKENIIHKKEVTRGYHDQTYNFYPFAETSLPEQRILSDWGPRALFESVRVLALTLSYLRFKWPV